MSIDSGLNQEVIDFIAEFEAMPPADWGAAVFGAMPVAELRAAAFELMPPAARRGAGLAQNSGLVDSGIDLSFIRSDYRLHFRLAVFSLFLLLPALVFGAAIGAAIAFGLWASCYINMVPTLLICIRSAFSAPRIVLEMQSNAARAAQNERCTQKKYERETRKRVAAALLSRPLHPTLLHIFCL